MGDENFLGSYHAVITIEGQIIYFVPPDMKAFAAAQSSFNNLITGEEEQIKGSVDDFSYHCALETPSNGRDPNKIIHAGYSKQQYKSLAWLLKATGISLERFVTHGDLKLPLTNEPRCFNMEYFLDRMLEAQNAVSIDLGILEI